MKIVRLTAQNVKRLVAVEIKPDPDGNVIEVRGANGAGKSSVIDAIWFTLGGKSASPPKPIRDGQQTAVATVDLGELTVKRTWTPKDSYLSVTSPTGAEFKSPQKVLDEMVGTLTFDPMKFARQSDKERRDTLLALIGIEGKLTEFQTTEDEAMRERKHANQRATESMAAAKSIVVPDGTPDKPISIVALQAKMKAGMEKNHRNGSARTALEVLRQNCLRAQEQVEDDATVIAQLEDRLRTLRISHQDRQKGLNQTVWTHVANKEQVEAAHDVDVSDIETEIATALTTNEAVNLRGQYGDHVDDAQEWRLKANGYDDTIQRVRTQRIELLRETDWPIPGLGIEGDMVTFDGVPFEQCSSSEKIRSSLSIAMAMNPKLRVLLVEDGSLLDDESLRLLYDTVKSNDYQLWIERHGEDGEVGVVIVDGSVRGTAPEADVKVSSGAAGEVDG